jgi:tetratricopeptide (TPR) repeat protein
MLKAKHATVIILAITAFGASLTARSDMDGLRLLLSSEAWEEALGETHRLLKTGRDNAALWYSGGIAHRNLMRPDSALHYFQKASALDPGNYRMAMALASSYAGMHRFNRAKDLYTDLIRLDSLRLEPYVQLAALHLRDNEPRMALDIYIELSSRDPDNYIYYKSIATCYRRLRQDPETIRYLKMAHERNREDLSVNAMLAELYMITKNYRDGLEIAERGLEVDRNNQDLLFWSGFFNYTLGLYLQAIVRLEHAIKAGNESLRVIQFLGVSYFLAGKYEEAREYLEDAVTSGLQDYRVFNYLGIIYREKGDYEISEYYFLNSLALLSPSVRSITETWLHLVETHKSAGDTGKMIEAYQSALVYDADNPYLHYGLAYTLDTRMRDSEMALVHYLRFSEIAQPIIDSDKDLPSLLDHSAARIRRIREDLFFEGR